MKSKHAQDREIDDEDGEREWNKERKIERKQLRRRDIDSGPSTKGDVLSILLVYLMHGTITR